MNPLTQSQKNNTPVTFHRADAQLLWTTAAKLALGLTLIALFPLAPRASADSFFSTFFSTGNPDGKIGTLSRPASAGLVQTETADDFILSQSMVINQAIFTGLLPMGASLASIDIVEIEIYHVFPADSANPPSGNVPTRDNSPADVEINSATRDSSDSSLSFSPTLVSPFTVMNSVVTGINKSLMPFTGGEGTVSGTEVMIAVTFNPPIALPADHYFFRPEVGLSSGNFLWLSAPFPLFVNDRQSWIRNDNLAPDWLRIGTDITHQGPFNASFSLSGETIEQRIEELVPCSGPASGGTWKNHGQYVSRIAHVSQMFVNQGLISGSEKGQIVSAAARSNCGKKKH